MKVFSQYFYIIAANSLSSCKVPVEDTALIRKVTKKFNESLVFDPSEPRMAYTIRDPIRNGKQINKYTTYI